MNEQEIFYQAVEKQGPERDSFLEDVCQADSGMKQRLVKMLAAYDQPSNFLEQPALEQVDLNEVVEQAASHPAANPVDKKSDRTAGLNLDFLAPSSDPESLGKLDRFEILSVLGHGGMGIVFRGRDPELHRIVAIKVLYEDNIPPTALAASRQRFIREARAMATLRSDYIIEIYEVQKDFSPPFFVMQYIHGKSLRQKIEQEGPLGVEDILKIGIEIAQGLAAAHESPNKLIHRDIKPDNILLENSIERVKIVDFGLAKDTLAPEQEVTRSGEILGTLHYMAPEQAQSQAVDIRCDLYSFGVTLYCMATGYPPFRGKSVTTLLQKIVQEQPVPIQNIRPELPQRLASLIEKLMHKRPGERYQTAKEVVSELKLILTRLQQPNEYIDSGMFSETIVTTAPAQGKAAKGAEGIKTPFWQNVSTSYLKVAAIVFVLGLLGIGGIYYFTSLPDNERIDAHEYYVK